jgi:hypothetical protein
LLPGSDDLGFFTSFLHHLVQLVGVVDTGIIGLIPEGMLASNYQGVKPDGQSAGEIIRRQLPQIAGN